MSDAPDEHPRPSEATVKELDGNAFRCAKSDCARPLYRVDDETGNRVLNSRVAHIHARSRRGPRWKEMSSNENRSVSKLLLLCIDHSYEIDDPGLKSNYTADVLLDWKAEQLAVARVEPQYEFAVRRRLLRSERCWSREPCLEARRTLSAAQTT